MKAYVIKLSNGVDIQIDEDELDRVIQSIQSKMPARVRQGIFNPSFFVAIIADKGRIEESEVIKRINEDKKKRNMPNLIPELTSLKDIFSGYKQLK